MKPRRRTASVQEDNVDSWLMSYADMITLLLCFFIIFVATSEPKQEKLKAATKGMKEYFGSITLETPYDGVYREVQGLIAAKTADSFLAAERTPRGIKIELSSLAFFASGSAQIAPEQLPVIQELAHQLSSVPAKDYMIEVEGYASDAPVESALFANSWELAAARAAQVVKLLSESNIDPARLKVVSYGSTHPVVPNHDSQGTPIPENQARNERVVVKMEKAK